jgi:hypothetical protein
MPVIAATVRTASDPPHTLDNKRCFKYFIFVSLSLKALSTFLLFVKTIAAFDAATPSAQDLD